MSEPPDLRDLLGDDVPAEELKRLRRIDALLRSVPAPPPQVPPSLTRAVRRRVEAPARVWTPRRAAAAVAVAAALAAVSFGLGTRAGGDGDFEERVAIPMRATAAAEGASAIVRVGRPDESGNWPLRLEVKGLEPLPKGGYYLLWLAKDGEYGVACGSFRVGKGTTELEWDVSYRLADYDTWVITAYRPGEPREADRPWLLRAKVGA